MPKTIGEIVHSTFKRKSKVQQVTNKGVVYNQHLESENHIQWYMQIWLLQTIDWVYVSEENFIKRNLPKH